MYKHIYQWKFCVSHLICQHLKLSNFKGLVKEKGPLKKCWMWILKEENIFLRKEFILEGVLYRITYLPYEL